MKRVTKLTAAVAVAWSLGVLPQANATITLKHDGLGDALLFPAFNGYIENYITISNTSNEWLQGHIRFRGASWSAELRDFDVIFSPGDVLVFRVADLDGDGQWEIDESLDVNNFQYTGMVFYHCGSSSPCIKPSNALEPVNISDGERQHQRNVGYIEFIGETSLGNGETPPARAGFANVDGNLGMTHRIMDQLVTDNAGDWEVYQTQNGNGRGVSAWKWSAAENNFRQCQQAGTRLNSNTDKEFCDRGLLDFPNVVSGTAFITQPGSSEGVAYNAEALVNFRTVDTDHRIDNYREIAGVPIAQHVPNNRAVIVHNENGNEAAARGTSPFGDYVYHFNDDRNVERRISFNNTWGPTLADGDDYSLVGQRRTTNTPNDPNNNLTPAPDCADIRAANADPNDDYDNWDCRFREVNKANRFINSIAEVEEAIRAGGQTFNAYYFDAAQFDMSAQGGKTTLTSNFFAYFPTKFFYGEDEVLYNSRDIYAYIEEATSVLLKMGKASYAEVWNTTENACTCQGGQNISPSTTPNPNIPSQGSTICDATTGKTLSGEDCTAAVICDHVTGQTTTNQACAATNVAGSTGAVGATCDAATGTTANGQPCVICDAATGTTTTGSACVVCDLSTGKTPTGASCSRSGLATSKGDGSCAWALGQELSLFDIDWVKGKFNDANCQTYTTGRVHYRLDDFNGSDNNPLTGNEYKTWPGLMYIYELDTQFEPKHWRRMQR